MSRDCEHTDLLTNLSQIVKTFALASSIKYAKKRNINV